MYLRNPFPVEKVFVLISIMKLRNNFSSRNRLLFFDFRYKCWECGQNGSRTGGTELHHIKGRCSSSVFNGAVLCKKCHSAVGHTFKEEQKYLQKTATIVFRAVLRNNYSLDENDKNFLVANNKYY